MDEVEVAGLRIAYERAGHGPPLVLVHGIVGDARGTWGHQLEALSDEFTVVAWDGPGTGRSADPPDGFRLPEFADCLAGFVAALGLQPPTLPASRSAGRWRSSSTDGTGPYPRRSSWRTPTPVGPDRCRLRRSPIACG